jgi:putative ABC transport system permease protein
MTSLAPSIRVGFAALRSNVLRTTLSALGVIIGVGAMVSVLSLSDGVESAIRSQLSRDGRLQSLSLTATASDVVDGLGIERANPVKFSPSDAADLSRALAGSGSAFMMSTGAGLVSDSAATSRRPRAASIIGTLANGDKQPAISLEAGRFFDAGEVDGKARVAVISRQLADTIIGKSVSSGSLIGKAIRLEDSVFHIIGVWKVDAKGNLANITLLRAYVPITTVPAATGGRESGSTSKMMVKASSIESLPAAQRGTEAWLARRYGNWKNQVKVSSYAEESAQVRDNMVLFKILMSAITGVSLVVGGVGIMNVLLASVTERTREIGVRKATGARNKDLLAQFLSESVAIAGLGSVLGTVLGISVAATVAAVMRAKTLAQVHAGFSLSTLLVAILAPAIVGIAFGIYPALRAARLSPIDAIRHE